MTKTAANHKNHSRAAIASSEDEDSQEPYDCTSERLNFSASQRRDGGTITVSTQETCSINNVISRVADEQPTQHGSAPARVFHHKTALPLPLPRACVITTAAFSLSLCAIGQPLPSQLFFNLRNPNGSESTPLPPLAFPATASSSSLRHNTWSSTDKHRWAKHKRVSTGTKAAATDLTTQKARTGCSRRSSVRSPCRR